MPAGTDASLCPSAPFSWHSSWGCSTLQKLAWVLRGIRHRPGHQSWRTGARLQRSEPLNRQVPGPRSLNLNKYGGCTQVRLEWSPGPVFPGFWDLKAPPRSSNSAFLPCINQIEKMPALPIHSSKPLDVPQPTWAFFPKYPPRNFSISCLQTPRSPKFPASHHLLEVLQEEVPSF